MQFGSAVWLYMLWLAPVLAVLFRLGAHRRRAALERFADSHLLEAIAPGERDRPRYRKAASLTVATALIIFSLAQPKWGYQWEEIQRQGVDIVIALDTSKSMLADDLAPTRLGRSKLAVQDLLDALPGDRVALVAFAGSAFVECPLTLDYGFCKTVLADIDVDTIPYGGTNVGGAIRKSLDAFEDTLQQHKALIIITDGENLEGDPVAAAEAAKEKGVKIFTMGVGSRAGSLIPQIVDGERRYLKNTGGTPINTRLDEEMLQRIALTTGGKYVRAAGGGDPLMDIYKAGIEPLEDRSLGMSRIRRYEHRFQWPLALALFILLFEEGSLAALMRRLVKLLRFRHVTTVVLLMVCCASSAFAEPVYKRVREGNKLFEGGKYQDAYDRYSDAQIDAPEMRELDFNIASTLFRQGKYEEAIEAYSRGAGSVRRPVEAAAHYGIGNSKFAMGEKQGSLELMREAIDSYRQTLEITPDDADAKFNIEFVQRRIKELINEQQEQEQEQEQEQNQEEQEEQQQQQQQQQGEEKQEDESAQQQEGEKDEQEQPQQEEGEEDEQEQQERQERRELSREEAEAALRAFEEEEAKAREESKRNQQAPYRRPTRDW
jgi:Ca-activated chloride channel family protein